MSDPTRAPRVDVPGYPPGYAPPPARDPALVPRGEYCYHVVPLARGEEPSRDIAAFGRGLREYPYSGRGDKQVLCPFWYRTHYGAVGCAFLGVEAVDALGDERDAAEAHFGGAPACERQLAYSWELPDEIKVCGVNVPELFDWHTPDERWLHVEEVGPVPLPPYLRRADP